MNKSKGNMYDFVTHTWNPLAGECQHKCSYCSTNKLKMYPGILNKYSGQPRLVEKELTSLGKDNFIFVCAQNDLFAKEVSTDIIYRILNHCSRYDNKYLFQTKNPARILSFMNHSVFAKSVVCTTIESDIYWPEEMGNAPRPYYRAEAMHILSQVIDTYVTIEPLLDFSSGIVDMIRRCNPKQVNIGADSGNNNLPEPGKIKLLQLISILEKFTVVHQKSNLQRLLS